MKAQHHILITEMAVCVYDNRAVSGSIQYPFRLQVILTVNIKDSTETLCI